MRHFSQSISSSRNHLARLLTLTLLSSAMPLPALAQVGDAISPPPAPPLSYSTTGKSSRGVFVLPGTMTRRNTAPLPALPREDAVPTSPRRNIGSPLPSPRRLKQDDRPPRSTAGRNSGAATSPLNLQYIRRNTPQQETYYPAPTIAQPVIPQPATPTHVQPQVTVAPAIPTTSEWQIIEQDAPDMLIPQTPTQQTPTQMATPQADTNNADLQHAFETIIQPQMTTDVGTLQTTPQVPASITPQADTQSDVAIALDAVPAIETELATPAPSTPVVDLPLSEESRKILERVPSGIDTVTRVSTPKPVVINRKDPDAGRLPSADVRSHEELGLRIEVRRPDVNIQSYLENGYENLLEKRYAIAAGYYQEALRVERNNESALFGLATTYHRMEQRDEAKQLYSELLAINPTHREGLNNFMALISEESPSAAIAELEKLETENPDFSPIPAQLGVVYNRLGDHRMAARKLARALNLSPDNLAYKYNLAITLDKLGQVEQASDLYMELVTAYNQGATLPGDVQEIRNRIISLNQKG